MALTVPRRLRWRRPGGLGALLWRIADEAATRQMMDHKSITETADGLVARMFTEEGASLVRLARLFTDDRNAAEDLVQEAFIRLHRSANRLRDPDKVAPYLRSIVLNLARDHNRRGLMSLRHRNAMEPETPMIPLEDTVVAAAQHRVVVEALRDLAPRQRDCLVLRFFFDLTERQIGDTLGISPNSVKTHCRRGMTTLATKLGRLNDD